MCKGLAQPHAFPWWFGPCDPLWVQVSGSWRCSCGVLDLSGLKTPSVLPPPLPQDSLSSTQYLAVVSASISISCCVKPLRGRLCQALVCKHSRIALTVLGVGSDLYEGPEVGPVIGWPVPQSLLCASCRHRGSTDFGLKGS